MQFNRLAVLDVGPPGEQGLRIVDQRIAFRVIKTAEKSANVLDVDVYNLAPSTRALLEHAGNRIVLSAGYSGGEVSVLAMGDVTNYETAYQPPDLVTKVIAGDGLIALTDARLSVTYGEGTTAEEIVRGIAGEMGLDDSEIRADLQQVYRTGYGFCGRAKDALDEVASRCGFTWSVQNNGLQILDESTVSARQAVVVNPETGLIGSPKPMQDLDANMFGAPPSDGILFECLLNGKIEPGTEVVLTSREFDGVQLVADNVTHVGDTHAPGGSWRTTVEARRL